jgi:Spy/CpxP family protein refolding chaperone
MKSRIYSITFLLILVPALLYAQQDPNRSSERNNPRNDNTSGKEITTNPPRPDINLVNDNFFPPEMVMRNQKEIRLKESQQTAIKEEMKKTLTQFTELKWEESAEEETMIALVKQPQVDEKKALAQFEKILSIEDAIKKVHLKMLIKVKNILTPEQQTKLFEMRKQRELSPDRPDQRRENNLRDGRPGSPPPGRS